MLGSLAPGSEFTPEELDLLVAVTQSPRTLAVAGHVIPLVSPVEALEQFPLLAGKGIAVSVDVRTELRAQALAELQPCRLADVPGVPAGILVRAVDRERGVLVELLGDHDQAAVRAVGLVVLGDDPALALPAPLLAVPGREGVIRGSVVGRTRRCPGGLGRGPGGRPRRYRCGLLRVRSHLEGPPGPRPGPQTQTASWSPGQTGDHDGEDDDRYAERDQCTDGRGIDAENHGEGGEPADATVSGDGNHEGGVLRIYLRLIVLFNS